MAKEEQERGMSKGAKLAYKPVGILGGVLAGVISGAIVDRIWSKVSDEPERPKALSSDYGFREVVLAAALQGAVFAATKTAIDRAGAVGFQRATGAWPGD